MGASSPAPGGPWIAAPAESERLMPAGGMAGTNTGALALCKGGMWWKELVSEAVDSILASGWAAGPASAGSGPGFCLPLPRPPGGLPFPGAAGAAAAATGCAAAAAVEGARRLGCRLAATEAAGVAAR
jgi:hypothetical protein